VANGEVEAAGIAVSRLSSGPQNPRAEPKPSPSGHRGPAEGGGGGPWPGALSRHAASPWGQDVLGIFIPGVALLFDRAAVLLLLAARSIAQSEPKAA
jgi:hypothetical protein